MQQYLMQKTNALCFTGILHFDSHFTGGELVIYRLTDAGMRFIECCKDCQSTGLGPPLQARLHHHAPPADVSITETCCLTVTHVTRCVVVDRRMENLSQQLLSRITQTVRRSCSIMSPAPSMPCTKHFFALITCHLPACQHARSDSPSYILDHHTHRNASLPQPLYLRCQARAHNVCPDVSGKGQGQG